MGQMVERAQIVVKGIVQGVGFRPYVFNLAETLGLKGYVSNTNEGVFIDVEGSHVPEFVRRLRKEAPPLARVTDVSVTSLPIHGYLEFTIHKSTDKAGSLPFTLISPDVSICDDCLRELLDPANRRYLYPFINCTNCGPRYTITKKIPYDRPNTTMAGFTMCPHCLSEYVDPRNRRFHAQPNACPECGPDVEFRVRGVESGIKGKEALGEAIKLLQKGGIVAIKGLGGFHIACDAANDDAVKKLREKKRKSNKPFAVMASSIEAISRFCAVSEEEKKLLHASRRPVVLLHKSEGQKLSDAVSPNNQFIGVMLPYTPLHYLLYYHPLGADTVIREPRFEALVMTSGNLSEEPIVRDNDEAVQKLSDIVDGFLLHDRDIFTRVDDSVVRIADCGLRVAGYEESSLKSEELQNPQSAISFIRRSRGYAPGPIMLREEGPEVLGCGADLKSTFTMTKGAFAIPSQHIGDMENYETMKFFEESLEHLKAVYRADPRIVVHDLHPGYLSTQWAIDFGIRNPVGGMKDTKAEIRIQKPEIERIAIQHHYAHIGSVMAEHGLKDKVIGVAFDGTGYGADGNLWGGEFLIADIAGFERCGHFQYIALPGGESAIREPWKTAVGCIVDAAGDGAWGCLETTGFVQRYGKDALEKVMKVKRSRELSPLSSGAGRLFDAVSALLGVCDRNTFEGEAAMALESLTRAGIEEGYAVEFKNEKGYTVVNFNRAFISMAADIARAVQKEAIATKFHNTVASVIRTMVQRVSGASGLREVALGGGTFQNQYLLKRALAVLSSDGMNVFINQKVPCNDGGISLGQAYLVRERLKQQCGMPRKDLGKLRTERAI